MAWQTRETLARRTATAATLPSKPRSEHASEQHATIEGGRIGRYVVLSRLGAGAMGEVFSAYDPQLDRKVALKRLKPRGDELRLEREAQALGRLDHPNVVMVHDFGVHEDRLFVAMEFVEGQTLGAWMRAGPHPWPEVLRVFTEAGGGLAAAHEAALIHRDFKPDNAMLGDDGRVRVMDFGLARAGGEQGETLDELVTPRALGGALARELTQAGALLGTPAYMSPEQLRGQQATELSDQFSFCVALYEALYGQRPFGGRSLAQLLEAIEEQRIEHPAAPARAVPAWLRRVLVRGLSAAPEQRFASMRALLDALADDPALRRRRWVAAVLVLGLIGGSVWGGAALQRRNAMSCEGVGDKLASVWAESQRARVRAAIEGTQLSYAGDTWIRVERSFDDFAAGWVDAREQACVATKRGEQSQRLLDLRMRCLDESLLEFGALVTALEVADATTVTRASEAALALPPLARCSDIEALEAEVPPPTDPELAARVEQLRAWQQRASALYKLGQYEEALEIAQLVRGDAEALGYAPLEVESRVFEGVACERQRDYACAETTLERAYALALEQQMMPEAATAATVLVDVVGVRLARHDEGRRWAVDAGPLARGIGSEAARTAYFNSMGLLAHSEGSYEEARRHHEAALAERLAALGPDHSEVAASLSHLAGIALDRGRYTDARAHLERVLEIRHEVLGEQHPAVGDVLNQLGIAAGGERKLDDARAYHERALRLLERVHGPDNLALVAPLHNLGFVLKRQGLLPEARAHYERALAISEPHLAPEHPTIAGTLTNLGSLAYIEGAHADALSYHARSLAGFEAQLGPAHPILAHPLTGLGLAHLARAELELALPVLERALELRAEASVDATDLADTRFALARVLWALPPAVGRDRVRAESLAVLAREAYRDAGEAWREELDHVERWERSLGAAPQ